MFFGMNVPPFGDFAEPQAVAELARDAEAAGWDGFFIWDHMIFDPSFHPIVDTWVALAAIAMSTSRIRIGPMITPLPRRRPWKVARETVSVERLSGGRLTLGVGIGDPVQWDFGFFGEEQDARTRAEQLDEGLDLLTSCWRGERFSHSGKHYQLQEVLFQPPPIQSPRIPIWVAGNWPNKPPFRRAARWDGVVPGSKDNRPLTPDDWRDMQGYIAQHRTSEGPFDLVHSGRTTGRPSEDSAAVAPFADVGVTWWIEDISPWRFGFGWEEQWSPDATRQMRERVLLGPPQI